MAEEIETVASLPAPAALRELQAARDIAQAFLAANPPAEVYRLALERVSPLVGAAFACVFLREPEGDLLRVVAAYNWPQAYASYLSEMRIRPGNGPTGQAFAENRAIEVFDIFADPALEDWWDSARELGFASSVSLPLAVQDRPAGVITLYFREPEYLRDADRNLLRLVADQLAATAEKAHLIDDLQRANTRLREQNVELEVRFREAEEARRLKTELLANVSHELRTPLTAILGYAYLLREGLSGPLADDQGAAVRKIEDAAAKLTQLINDLLDLTNLRLGRTTVESEACDAVALAQSAISAVAPPAGVEVKTEMPAKTIPVHTDPVQVIRVLQNLIANAFKFTSRGAVTIRVHGSDGEPDKEAGGENSPPAGSARVRWEIHDTGIGIAPEDQEAIFSEFRQVDGSATRRYGGTGLGLALARGLARSLGGDITLRSELGHGSTFALTLPADPSHSPGPQHESDNSPNAERQ